MEKHNLAEINIARMKGIGIDDPVMKEFVDNLDRINAIAEQSKGFVWRLKDDTNSATKLNPYNDERVIVNLSVWESIEDLEHYMYQTFHSDFLKRRREWFQAFGKAYMAMWWVPKGHIPTIDEAVAQLDHLQQHGPSQQVFNFSKKFPPAE